MNKMLLDLLTTHDIHKRYSVSNRRKEIEEVVAYFKVISVHWSVTSVVSGPIFTTWTFRIRSRQANSLTARFNTSKEQSLPLLVPSGPRRIVHSSMVPNGANNWRTSSSVCCLLSIPTNSFLSSEDNREHTRQQRQRNCLALAWF
jgi:hypothetical protein